MSLFVDLLTQKYSFLKIHSGVTKLSFKEICYICLISFKGRIICQNKMGFTLKVLMCVFGFVLIIKTIPTDAEDEIAKREDGELPCIWQCPIILDKCLLKGGGKSLCNKVAQRCNSICIAEETHVKKSREIRYSK